MRLNSLCLLPVSKLVHFSTFQKKWAEIVSLFLCFACYLISGAVGCLSASRRLRAGTTYLRVPLAPSRASRFCWCPRKAPASREPWTPFHDSSGSLPPRWPFNCIPLRGKGEGRAGIHRCKLTSPVGSCICASL